MSLNDKLTALANSIRTKSGTSGLLSLDAMKAAVDSISGGITPMGNINITDTNVTDVTNYATATIVDDDLVAENIKKDVNILGVVGSFEGGGGGDSGYEMHTVNFTLAQSTNVWDILPIYTDECSDWVIYPADASNTSLNTIVLGTWWRSGHQHAQGYGRFKDIVTPIGVTLPDLSHSYYINDQTYNILRARNNPTAKSAGEYVLKFYGIAK